MRTSLTRCGTCVSLAPLCVRWQPSFLLRPRPRAPRRRPSNWPKRSMPRSSRRLPPRIRRIRKPSSRRLYFQGSQLLVVSAKYAAPPLLVAKIKEQNYRDVYIDLSSASVAGSKVFVIDAGVDGLAPKPGDSGADSYEQGTEAAPVRWRLEEGEDLRGRVHEGRSPRPTSATRKMLALLQAQAKTVKAGS